MTKREDGYEAFAGLVDLASDELGAEALLCSDDFFAGMRNLTRPEPAVFDPDAYTDRGKLMDGWESRRRRTPGNDWCILRLGVPGEIHGVDIDTAFFMGNHAPFASLDAANVPADTSPEDLRDRVTWTPLLRPTPMRRGSHNVHAVRSAETWTHVRLTMLPDGGIARLRVYGEPRPAELEGELDLACLANGGRALACSDMFFAPMHQLLLPKRAEHMGRGWETRRSRPPGDDWILVALGAPGRLDRFVLDTNHFKGNYPDRAQIEALHWPDAPTPSLIQSPDWKPITGQIRMRAHEEIEVVPDDPGPWTHLRLRIWPDGGVSRLRAFGTVDRDGHHRDDPLLTALNDGDRETVRGWLRRCCGSERWVEGMLAARPFTSRAHLFGQAEVVWWWLSDGDWHQAFDHHPRIGADLSALRARYAETATWSSDEQAGVAGASEATLEALAQGNRDYEARYGHLFLVCASGLSADEMLGRLRARMDNDPAAELRIAAGEQARITRLRLDKLEFA
jgi:allantoicase